MVAPAFAFQLTWPSLPVVYYGDEIGMRYLPGLPGTEGSQLGHEARAGLPYADAVGRRPNAGFSSAPADDLYLPVDPAGDRPDVAAQREDAGSLLHQVRALIRLRREHRELGTHGTVEVLRSGYPLVYMRGDAYLVAVNPGGRARRCDLGEVGVGPPLLTRGVEVRPDGTLTAEPFSYGVFRLAP